MRKFIFGALVGVIFVLLLFLGMRTYLLEKPAPALSGDSFAVQTTDRPPEYLLINRERWYVVPANFQEYDKNTPDRFTDGLTDCSERKIWYTVRPISSPALREVLWHEIVHASYCYQGSRMKANWNEYVRDHAEHEIVYEMGMFMPGFVHDNPEFMKWAGNWK